MQTSEYFDLGLYEGTDIFNPLIVENENIEKIDEQMFLNSIAGVGQATELKSGTVHAITRVNPDASMFRFVATSKFDRGDTFTVDGIQVTGLRTDGKALDDGAYVINANVLCCLTGTVLTLFVATGDVAKADDADRLGGELPAYYGTASDVQQAITVAQAAGVLANDLQGQVTTINSNLRDLSNFVTDGDWVVEKRDGFNIARAHIVRDVRLDTSYNSCVWNRNDIVHIDFPSDYVSEISITSAYSSDGIGGIMPKIVTNGIDVRVFNISTTGHTLNNAVIDLELVYRHN